MKSKEAIRNKIIHYANLTWGGTKNVNNLNPLISLMVEVVSSELYLLDNKLNDIDSTILEKLVDNLSPSMFNYVRPAHAILYKHPDSGMYYLGKRVPFFLMIVPNHLKSRNITSVVFTPVVDVKLLNVTITHLFHNQTLWALNRNSNRSLLTYTNERATYNTVWIRLDVGDEVRDLHNLFFYIDFPHLNDNHEYYDILSEVEWSINGKPLRMKAGLPILSPEVPSKIESEILDFYADHYYTIQDSLSLEALPLENFPDNLSQVIDTEFSASLPKEYWISISFPAAFREEDLDKISIELNAFPVVNRQHNELVIEKQVLTDVISLPSSIGERFLEMDTIIDSIDNEYLPQDISGDQIGTYIIEPIQKNVIEDSRIADYLERLIDIVQDEKTAFPEIDNDKIVEVLNAISSIQDKDMQKLELNRLFDYAEVARLTISSYENISSITTSYWTTHIDQVNGLPEGTILMAKTIADLNKSNAILLTEVNGGRSFFDINSLKAINRFYLTSRDRILTKNDILSFCHLELGQYIDNIDVVKKVKISSKTKEGLINVMEIQITPLAEHVEYFNQKGVLKDLKIRLERRSPDSFNYRVKLLGFDTRSE